MKAQAEPKELRRLMRDAVRETLQEELNVLMFIECNIFIQEQGGRKNGGYVRSLDTSFGQIKVQVPRVRDRVFRSAFFEPHARRSPIIHHLLVLYAVTTSPFKKGEILTYVLGRRYAFDAIIHLTDEILERVEDFHHRHFLDTYPTVCVDVVLSRENIYGVFGVDRQGRCTTLGFYQEPGKADLGWQHVLTGLQQRGLQEVKFVVCDDLPGIREAVYQVYPSAQWQPLSPQERALFRPNLEG